MNLLSTTCVEERTIQKERKEMVKSQHQLVALAARSPDPLVREESRRALLQEHHLTGKDVNRLVAAEQNSPYNQSR